MISLTSPVRTRAQDWPAGWKLAALCLATTGLFLLKGLGPLLIALGLTFLLYLAPGREFLRAGVFALRPLAPFVILVATWHLVLREPMAGAEILLRLVSAVALANLVTMTTSLEDFSDLVSRICAPLRRIGLPVHLLEISLPLVIRFTPVLIAKAEMLKEAWRARSRRRPGWRIVLPLTLLALDDADQVAEALRARSAPPD